MLAAINNLSNSDMLIVSKRDRLGRAPIQVAMIERAIERKQARIVSAAGEGPESNDPASILMRRMMDAFAEYERLFIGARIRAAMQAKKKKGDWVGSVPYGFQVTDDNKLIEQPQKQKVIAEVRKLHDAEQLKRHCPEANRNGV